MTSLSGSSAPRSSTLVNCRFSLLGLHGSLQVKVLNFAEVSMVWEICIKDTRVHVKYRLVNIFQLAFAAVENVMSEVGIVANRVEEFDFLSLLVV